MMTVIATILVKQSVLLMADLRNMKKHVKIKYLFKCDKI